MPSLVVVGRNSEGAFDRSSAINSDLLARSVPAKSFGQGLDAFTSSVSGGMKLSFTPRSAACLRIAIGVSVIE